MENLAMSGNPRYQPKQLQRYFGYDNLYGPFAEVEIAALKTLAEIGIIPAEEVDHLSPELEHQLRSISTTDVDTVERNITNHDARAWIHIAQGMMPSFLARWLHVPLTTYDPMDTARALTFLRVHRSVVRPLTDGTISYFVALIRQYAKQKQIGRTHLQHALPITIGFWLATVLSRIVYNIQSANAASEALVGKISGAVGAYNAQVGLGILERCGEVSFEERVLAKVGLKPARISTQILPPEPLADYLFSCIKLSASLGQFGRDGRRLMATEIDEIREPFTKDQVGSSTMAHKRNPINFENLEGTWLKTKNEFGKVLDTMISDHQRDLVGSSIMRDFPTIVINLVSQLNTLLRRSEKTGNIPFISRITVDAVACDRNLRMQGDAILAEPVYIALQMVGYKGDAHNLVNHRALAVSKATKVTLFSAVAAVLEEKKEVDVLKAWNALPAKITHLLQTPEEYLGLAAEKALEIADAADVYLQSRST